MDRALSNAARSECVDTLNEPLSVSGISIAHRIVIRIIFAVFANSHFFLADLNK